MRAINLSAGIELSVLVNVHKRTITVDTASLNIHVTSAVDPLKNTKLVPSGGAMIFPKRAWQTLHHYMFNLNFHNITCLIRLVISDICRAW